MTQTLFRTVILYLCVVIVMRVMGKRQIGEMQPNELVVTILISELAAIPMQDLNRPLTNGIIAILMLACMEILISAVSLKSKKARRVLNGKAVTIIHNGVIDQRIMRRMRLTVDDLTEDLRIQGVFKIEDVLEAIIETNGKMSVLQKVGSMPATADQMKAAAEENTLPAVIISDGLVHKDNYRLCGMNDDKLGKALKTRRLKPRDVFLMTADSNDKYIVIKKDGGNKR